MTRIDYSYNTLNLIYFVRVLIVRFSRFSQKLRGNQGQMDTWLLVFDRGASVTNSYCQFRPNVKKKAKIKKKTH